uniref:B-like cyclin n=3 Tax=Cajanus cajan TaxID=3821 RepID=A0A151UHU7_CAJCA
MLKNPRPLRDRCVSDIYEYLRWIEIDPTRAPSPNYIEKVQCDISAYTRAIVVGWLVEKTDKYELVSDVLYSSVAYLDRFLSFNNTPIDKMLLLGLSSLLVASKYEDRRALTIEDLRYIAGYSCSNQEVVNMEADILKVLKFELGSPTVNTFLTRFVTVGQEDIDNSSLHFEPLSRYIAELSLFDYHCLKFLPSLVAASVVFLTRFILSPNTNPWNSKLHQITRYTPAHMKECVLSIHDFYLRRRWSSVEIVREKYRQSKFNCVAATPIPPEIPLSFFEFNETDF